MNPSASIIKVPDLEGLSLNRAMLMLQTSNIEVGEVLYKESYEDKNTVLAQEPRKGQILSSGQQITLWVARRGCVEDLPAIYRRDDALGRNVMRDVCYLFEHMFGEIGDSLAEGDRFYDPHVCPQEFLPWLASWTAMSFDHGWDEEKQRALVKRAVDLFRLRGTKKGLMLFLQLFTGHEPEIEEHVYPVSGCRTGNSRIGVDAVVMHPPRLAHCFVVTLPKLEENLTPEFILRVHRIIQMERPAHTTYYLQFGREKKAEPLQAMFAVGINARLGVNVPETEKSVPKEEKVPATKPEKARVKPATTRKKTTATGTEKKKKTTTRKRTVKKSDKKDD